MPGQFQLGQPASLKDGPSERMAGLRDRSLFRSSMALSWLACFTPNHGGPFSRGVGRQRTAVSGRHAIAFPGSGSIDHYQGEEVNVQYCSTARGPKTPRHMCILRVYGGQVSSGRLRVRPALGYHGLLSADSVPYLTPQSAHFFHGLSYRACWSGYR